MKKLEEHGEKPVTKEEGEALAKKLGAYAFCMCSGKTQVGITEVFKKASETGLLYQGVLNSSDLEGGSGGNNTSKTNTSPNNASQNRNGEKKGCCLVM